MTRPCAKVPGWSSPDPLYVRLILQLVRDVESGEAPAPGAPPVSMISAPFPWCTAGSGRPSAIGPASPCWVRSTTAPVDWLTAGQALERILLQSAQDGLVASLAFQPFEWPGLRWAEDDPTSAVKHIHMVLHLDTARRGYPTPRRPVAEMLEIA